MFYDLFYLFLSEQNPINKDILAISAQCVS